MFTASLLHVFNANLFIDITLHSIYTQHTHTVFKLCFSTYGLFSSKLLRGKETFCFVLNLLDQYAQSALWKELCNIHLHLFPSMLHTNSQTALHYRVWKKNRGATKYDLEMSMKMKCFDAFNFSLRVQLTTMSHQNLSNWNRMFSAIAINF